MIGHQEFLKLEQSFDTSSIIYEGEWVYPLIKQGILIPKLNLVNKNEHIPKSSKGFSSLKIFIDALKSLNNLKIKNKSDYLFIDNAGSRRITVNDKWFSIYSDSVIELLGQKNSIIIEESRLSKPYYISNIFSKKVFYLSSRFNKVFIKSKLNPKKNNPPSFDVLFKHFGIEVTSHEINSFFSKVYYFEKTYKRILKRFKPKAVFVVCAYAYKYMPLIQACKKLNIPTIELQHGLIYHTHLGYNYKQNHDDKFFPDYFFSYGEKSNDILLESKIFSEDQIITIGSPFLEFYDNNQTGQLNTEFKDFIKRKRVILITSQETVQETIISFVEEILPNLPNEYVVLLKPHPGEISPETVYKSILNDPQVLLVINENILTLLQLCNIHSTVYSTSFYEATYFDVPTIFIKSDRYSQTVEDYIDNQMFFIANTSSEYNKALKQLNKLNTKYKEDKFYSKNTSENITKALAEIGVL